MASDSEDDVVEVAPETAFLLEKMKEASRALESKTALSLYIADRRCCSLVRRGEGAHPCKEKEETE